ncbi:calmodulin, putative [Hepatocystis sp. ex Piliocolobus tephrosceles]|nr:calmodulin, putative [Hepatocystis sp. ex Piliocolobus tephrosceles]
MVSTDALIKESFTIMDNDFDGKLALSELVIALRILGISSHMDNFNDKDDVLFSYDEYKTIAQKELGSSTPEQKFTEVLNQLDKNKSGQLSVETLRFLVLSICNNVSDSDVSNFIDYINPEHEENLSTTFIANKLSF